jgi:Uma2 family endonuclease
VAGATPLKRAATYDDLCRVPDHLVAEILDGDLFASPRPAIRHAHAASTLGAEIGGPFHQGRGGPGGWWILDEPELHLHDDVVVPDLAGWRRARLPVLPDAAFISLAPDWVCEVLSPSTASLDRLRKLRIYAREGVAHTWLLDPILRTLEILGLENGRWTIVSTVGGQEVVHAEPFEILPLELARLWPDEPASS